MQLVSHSRGTRKHPWISDTEPETGKRSRIWFSWREQGTHFRKKEQYVGPGGRTEPGTERRPGSSQYVNVNSQHELDASGGPLPTIEIQETWLLLSGGSQSRAWGQGRSR